MRDVDVLDHGVHERLLCLVMERLHGENLADRLISERSLSLQTATAIGTQLASAMAFAHGRGVFHRDLKPGNVFLAQLDGRDGRVKVLDFGLAKVPASQSVTKTNDVFGTLEYMSPEQVASSKGATGPADVYAMGAIMYEMLAGHCPD